jgi:glycosyltransferase involved in cell wall biosynthesis
MNMQTIKSHLKKSFPHFFGILFALRRRLVHDFSVWRISRLRKASSGVFVTYLTGNFPQRPASRQEHAHGGAVKMTYLAEEFPHAFPSANLLYAVSSVGHSIKPEIVAGAKKKKLKIVVNQNGVAYPAWHGAGWESTNYSLKQILDQADYILYQSHFCQVGAERFLFPPKIPSEVVYNPVDIHHFALIPASQRPKNLTLLLGGNQFEKYRFELAVRVFREVLNQVAGARLLVTGKLWLPEQDAIICARKLLQDLALSDEVVFTGTYTQEQAPLIFAQAHILLHTQYNDSSPTLVLEAMASGLPVVYVGSGGVPELVGDAGIGLPVKNSWEKINLPDPQEMGAAVLNVMSRYSEFSAIARERAVRRFSLESFISKHREIFMKVLDS